MLARHLVRDGGDQRLVIAAVVEEGVLYALVAFTLNAFELEPPDGSPELPTLDR